MPSMRSCDGAYCYRAFRRFRNGRGESSFRIDIRMSKDRTGQMTRGIGLPEHVARGSRPLKLEPPLRCLNKDPGETGQRRREGMVEFKFQRGGRARST